MPQLLTIGAYETKTHLADLLRQVRSGQGFTITQRGEPVADLLPAGTGARRAGMAAARQMQTFMAEAPAGAPCDSASASRLLYSSVFMAEAPAGAPCDLESLLNEGRD